MARETELKFIGVESDALRQRLQAGGAISHGRHLERNTVYDTGGRSLRAARMLLRLRVRMWGDREEVILTLKRPPQGPVPAGVKVWEEDETSVGDAASMHAMLGGLGYEPAFRYDKVREDWAWGGVHVSLDSLVFGDVVEIEGARDAIFEAAGRLGLGDCETSTATYHDLNRQWRESTGLPACDDFVFRDEDARRIMDELRASLAAGLC